MKEMPRVPFYSIGRDNFDRKRLRRQLVESNGRTGEDSKCHGEMSLTFEEEDASGILVQIKVNVGYHACEKISFKHLTKASNIEKQTSLRSTCRSRESSFIGHRNCTIYCSFSFKPTFSCMVTLQEILLLPTSSTVKGIESLIVAVGIEFAV